MASGRAAKASSKKRKTREPDSMSVGVKAIMAKRVQSVRPDTTLETAMELLMSKDISHLPVVEEGRLVGVLSKTDLVRDRFLNGTTTERSTAEMVGFHEDDEGTRVVADLMSKKVRAVNVAATIAEAAIEMTRFRVHGLPVVNDAGGLVGFVSTLDVVRWVAQLAGR